MTYREYHQWMAFKRESNRVQQGDQIKKKHPAQPSQKQQTTYEKTIQNSEQHHEKEIT